VGVRTVEIETDDYNVVYQSDIATVFLRGFLRLPGMPEYESIMNLLLDAIDETPALTLNLQGLEFLNSSGISMLSMFVVKVRNQGQGQLVIQGSNQVLWQTKSLRNLQRLMPSLKLEFA
jgi:anti-anti-sigma factor